MIVSRAVQPLNTWSPILVRVLGNTTDTRFVQQLNVETKMLVMLPRDAIDVILVAEKAQLLRVVRPGIFNTPESFVFWKACEPIEATD